MDRILIRDLRIDAVIGIEPHERLRRQPLVLHLELGTDIRAAAASESIEDALNYDAIVQRLIALVGQSGCQLIETLAERIAELLQVEFGVSWLRLELHKPQALSGGTNVGLIIERGSCDPS